MRRYPTNGLRNDSYGSTSSTNIPVLTRANIIPGNDVLKWADVPVLAESGRLSVVLVAVRNPLNIGAAARAMSNFGFQRLRVVNPYDVAFREARSAVGAPQLLAKAEEFKSVADAVADCDLVVGTTGLRQRETQHPLRLLPAGGAATVTMACPGAVHSCRVSRKGAGAVGGTVEYLTEVRLALSR